MSDSLEQPSPLKAVPTRADASNPTSRFAEAWWQHQRGQRATPPTANEFELAESLAAAVARQCEICHRYG